MPEIDKGKFSIIIRIDTNKGIDFYVRFHFRIVMKLDLHCLEALLSVIEGSNFMLIAVQTEFYKNKTNKSFWRDFDGDFVEFEHDGNRLKYNSWGRYTQYDLSNLDERPKKYCTNVSAEFLLSLFAKMKQRIEQLKRLHPEKDAKCILKKLQDELKRHGVPFKGPGLELAVYFLFCNLHAKNRLIVFAFTSPNILCNKMIGYKVESMIDYMVELDPYLRATADSVKTKMESMTRKRGFTMQVIGEISDAIDAVLPQLMIFLSNDTNFNANDVLLRSLALLYNVAHYICASCNLYNRFYIAKKEMEDNRLLIRNGPILSSLLYKVCESLVKGKQYVNLNLTTLPLISLDVAQRNSVGMQQSGNQCLENCGGQTKRDVRFTARKPITQETAHNKNYIKCTTNRRLIRQYAREDKGDITFEHTVSIQDIKREREQSPLEYASAKYFGSVLDEANAKFKEYVLSIKSVIDKGNKTIKVPDSYKTLRKDFNIAMGSSVIGQKRKASVCVKNNKKRKKNNNTVHISLE